MNNGQFAFCIVPMLSLVQWKMLLRKEIFHYRIYGGLSLPRKRLKMSFRLKSKDEEALMRVINYPARGIGNDN
jgi:DNA helicase-2/ATP-dependent DNA helicase PcrA